MAKLYPPTISENIPAFYKENGTVKITVPFSMNRAVLKDDISGFILKIKTVQGNIQLGTKSIKDGLEQIIKNKKVVFNLNESENEDKTIIEKIWIGQFLKVQMAYLDKNNEVGYYSTVGITKYTSKPILSIQGFKTEEDEDYSINHFPTKVIGEYQLGEDKTERPYSYNFSLYDEQNQLLETSGWILYNNNVNNTSNSLDIITTLPYYFRTVSEPNINYKMSFQVRTINNLEISSPNYECMEINIEKLLADDIYNAYSNPEGAVKLEKLKFDLKAKNNFEEGYINLFFEIGTEYSESENFYTIDNILIDKKDGEVNNKLNGLEKRGPGIKWDTINKTIHQYKLYDSNNNEKGYIRLYTIKNGEKVLIVNTIINQEDWKKEYFPIENSMSFEICRASDKDNFSKWSVLQRVTFKDSLEIINWSFKDVAIEQGIQYKYSFRQYNDNGLYSNREETEPIMADFEDIFLCDNDKQIKIRFNPKISSFKTTRLESKMDTIGGKYPFIFRNGIVEYKEFPIQGLISYYLDENEEFFKDSYKELGITFGKKLERLGNSKDLKDNINQQIKNLSTTNLENYNIKAEREFKLKLSDWLGNGEIKLFKSPSEGNYFVRLMNISLSPEDRLNRMIHSFSCQAYEVMDYNYDSLLNLNYYSLENEAVRYIGGIEDLKVYNYVEGEIIFKGDQPRSERINNKETTMDQKIQKTNKIILKENIFTIFNNDKVVAEYFCEEDGEEVCYTMFNSNKLLNSDFDFESAFKGWVRLQNYNNMWTDFYYKNINNNNNYNNNTDSVSRGCRKRFFDEAFRYYINQPSKYNSKIIHEYALIPNNKEEKISIQIEKIEKNNPFTYIYSSTPPATAQTWTYHWRGIDLSQSQESSLKYDYKENSDTEKRLKLITKNNSSGLEETIDFEKDAGISLGDGLQVKLQNCKNYIEIIRKKESD